ncbi:MAG: hypothetical protein KY396_05520 [Actinobacteria bacterium]|nr:hypothetical protein [Actinomycetota bacterium]
MPTEKREVALLRILIACGEKAIEAFQASDNIDDAGLLADLERVVARSRDELRALTERSLAGSDDA